MRALPKAAKVFEAGLTQTPDYRMAISQGRSYGFLGKWVDAAHVFAKLFEQEPLLNSRDKRKLDSAVTKAKPELTSAYIDWGVAERMAATVDGDKDRLRRCRDVIFTPLCNTLKADVKPQEYWASRYHLVKTLMDVGAYGDAQLSVEDVQRQVNPNFDEDKFGYKKLFEAAIEELKTKNFDRGAKDKKDDKDKPK